MLFLTLTGLILLLVGLIFTCLPFLLCYLCAKSIAGIPFFGGPSPAR